MATRLRYCTYSPRSVVPRGVVTCATVRDAFAPAALGDDKRAGVGRIVLAPSQRSGTRDPATSRHLYSHQRNSAALSIEPLGRVRSERAI